MSRCLFAVRHAARWVLANVAEFDRRHLHGTLRWLFAERAIRTRTVRPLRRIIQMTIAAAWGAFLVATCVSPPVASDLAVIGIAFAIAAGVGLAASAFLAGFRSEWRSAGKPRTLVSVTLVHEYSDGTTHRRPLGPNVTITSGRDSGGELRASSVKEYWP